MRVLKQGNYVFVLYQLYQYLEHHKADYEKQMELRSIDMRWGYEWAICCGVGCKVPCAECFCTDVPLS